MRGVEGDAGRAGNTGVVPLSRDITALRLSAQSIASTGYATPADVVRGMLAMQAQDYAGAKWSVGLRVAGGTTDAAIEESLARGEIVRSWPMRGTLHFVAPEDLRWMMSIAADRQRTTAAKRRADLEITDAQLERASELAHEVLSGGRIMRRDALLDVWETAGVSTAAQRAYHLLWNLGHRSEIVFGPVDGKQPTFALLDEWIPSSRSLEGDEALGEYALRYFTSHGPATVRDFAWWASIPLGAARIGLAIAAPSLESRHFDGVEHVMRPGLSAATPAVHALPGFDEYMLGYQDRSAGLPAEFADLIVPGNNGIFQPTIVVDGRIVGTWRRTESAKSVRVDATWFTPPSKRAVTGFEAAARRFGRFLGKPVVFGS